MSAESTAPTALKDRLLVALVNKQYEELRATLKETLAQKKANNDLIPVAQALQITEEQFKKACKDLNITNSPQDCFGNIRFPYFSLLNVAIQMHDDKAVEIILKNPGNIIECLARNIQGVQDPAYVKALDEFLGSFEQVPSIFQYLNTGFLKKVSLLGNHERLDFLIQKMKSAPTLYKILSNLSDMEWAITQLSQHFPDNIKKELLDKHGNEVKQIMLDPGQSQLKVRAELMNMLAPKSEDTFNFVIGLVDALKDTEDQKAATDVLKKPASTVAKPIPRRDMVETPQHEEAATSAKDPKILYKEQVLDLLNESYKYVTDNLSSCSIRTLNNIVDYARAKNDLFMVKSAFAILAQYFKESGEELNQEDKKLFEECFKKSIPKDPKDLVLDQDIIDILYEYRKTQEVLELFGKLDHSAYKDLRILSCIFYAKLRDVKATPEIMEIIETIKQYGNDSVLQEIHSELESRSVLYAFLVSTITGGNEEEGRAHVEVEPVALDSPLHTP